MAHHPLITALLPSRERPASLARAIGSLRDLAAYPDRITVMVAADEDDLATQKAAADTGSPCVVFERQGYDRLHVYYQQLAVFSMAKWLLVWNDDAVMMTNDWDLILDSLPRNALVADLQSRHSPMCCFPAVRREAVAAIGKFCSNNPHVDSFWEQVGRQSGTIITVPIEVLHEQQPGPHTGNEHGFHDPAHEAEIAACARLCRAVVLD